MNQHELLFIKSFVRKEKQERYSILLNSKTGRKKFRSYIAHFRDLNEDFIYPNKAYNSYKDLLSFLVSKNAPQECYCISEHTKYDQKNMLLSNALEELYNSGIAYFISSIPGKLAYYEGEEKNQQIILFRA